MLIPLQELFSRYPIKIRSVLHIGAHECEELNDYVQVGVSPEKIFWIEANPELVEKNNSIGIPNIIHAAVSDKEEFVDFIVTNNGQSSSILELYEHKLEHPHVFETSRIQLKTTTVEHLVDIKIINTEFPNFVNLDIQGAELKALKGFGKYLNQVDYIYTEVNMKYLYKDCALLHEIDAFLTEKGFRRELISMTRHGWGDAFYLRQNL